MQDIQSVYSPAKKSGKFTNAIAKQPSGGGNALDESGAGGGGFNKSSSLIGRQVEAEAASVDEKIEKLQNLLKMAKGS